ncbi:hypothetical protein Tco_1452006 [Tanacetum coccineum]
MFAKFPTHKGITIVCTCSVHHHLRYTLLKKQFKTSVFPMAMQTKSSNSSLAEQSLDMLLQLSLLAGLPYKSYSKGIVNHRFYYDPVLNDIGILVGGKKMLIFSEE